jgi:hypothetical protein
VVAVNVAVGEFTDVVEVMVAVGVKVLVDVRVDVLVNVAVGEFTDVVEVMVAVGVKVLVDVRVDVLVNVAVLTGCVFVIVAVLVLVAVFIDGVKVEVKNPVGPDGTLVLAHDIMIVAVKAHNTNTIKIE